MKPHAFVNIVIAFEPVWTSTVESALERLVDPLQGNFPCRDEAAMLDRVTGLHYLSITVARPTCPFEDYEGTERDSSGEKAHLLIEISTDLGPEEAIGELVEGYRETLHALLSKAGHALRTDEEMRRLLLAKRLEIRAGWSWPWSRTALGQVHCGSPGQQAERVRREARLADIVGEEIDLRVQQVAEWHEMSPRQRVESIRDWLWERGDSKWAFVPEPAPCLGDSPPDELSLLNPQIRKAGARIFHALAWPLYAPFALLLAGWFWFVMHGHGVLTAVLWSLHAVGYGALGAAILGWALYLRLRKFERRDPVDDRTPTDQQVRDLLAVENFGGQNHLASISLLKPGLFRRLLLRLAFTVVGTGPLVSTPGFLGKNGVIHFARWMVLPGGKQLAFWSNYDDTWESYVADFIADAPSGVTAIWSNCFGFPRTRSLFGGGAADRDRLVRWARRQQHPTRFWYQRYRNLTTARIRTNAAIRQGIASAESQQDSADWLSLFGSVPRPGKTLDLPEIPTLVFGGLSRLPFATCLLVSLRGPRREAWLQSVAKAVTYGELPHKAEVALALGLSRAGLVRLGVPFESIATFPVAFQQGMTLEARSRLLGDEADNAPRAWRWGANPDQVDAVIAIYGRTADMAAKLRSQIADMTRSLGHEIVFEQPLKDLPDPKDDEPVREPFGFVDGISQPVVRGSPRAQRWPNPNDLQEAGEFILGYPDNTTMIPPSPAIPARCDPNHLLPDAGPDPLRKRPDASTYEPRGWRDIGMNGTYLVVRHLVQDVAAYERWMKESIAELAAKGGIDWERRVDAKGDFLPGPVRVTLRGPNAAPAGEEPVPAAAYDSAKAAIGAKLVGRWNDGSSLVRYAAAPPTDEKRALDNDFTYAEDPNAIACPFGAHMRRANPRDSRYPGSADEIAATNRHRVMRVGRAYEKSSDGPQAPVRDERGLLFMCLNADIERQFEFVQRTWLLNPNMHGLQGEADPLVGPGGYRFTIPTGYGPLRLPPLPRLVTVRGGGYFFMPSRRALRFLVGLCDRQPMVGGLREAVVADVAAETVAKAHGLVG